MTKEDTVKFIESFIGTKLVYVTEFSPSGTFLYSSQLKITKPMSALFSYINVKVSIYKVGAAEISYEWGYLDGTSNGKLVAVCKIIEGELVYESQIKI